MRSSRWEGNAITLAGVAILVSPNPLVKAAGGLALLLLVAHLIERAVRLERQARAEARAEQYLATVAPMDSHVGELTDRGRQVLAAAHPAAVSVPPTVENVTRIHPELADLDDDPEVEAIWIRVFRGTDRIGTNVWVRPADGVRLGVDGVQIIHADGELGLTYHWTEQ